jgi:hypothetical protein
MTGDDMASASLKCASLRIIVAQRVGSISKRLIEAVLAAPLLATSKSSRIFALRKRNRRRTPEGAIAELRSRYWQNAALTSHVRVGGLGDAEPGPSHDTSALVAPPQRRAADLRRPSPSSRRCRSRPTWRDVRKRNWNLCRVQLSRPGPSGAATMDETVLAGRFYLPR